MLVAVWLASAAAAVELRLTIEWGGGSRENQLHWDGRITIENGRLLSVENAGLDGGGEGWRDQTEASLALTSMTEGGADGVLLVIDATPETRIRYDTPILPIESTVAELTRREIRLTRADGAWVTIRPAALEHVATPALECATLLVDGGALRAFAVRNDGDPKLAATRQVAVLGRFSEGRWQEDEVVAGPGLVYFTTAARLPDGGLLLAWSQYVGGEWHVYVARRGDPAEAPVQLSSGAANFCPALYAGPEGVWCAWQSAVGHQFRIVARRLDSTGWGEPLRIDASGSAARPALAGDGERVWLAFDVFVGRDFDAMVCRLGESGATSPEAVLAGPAEELSPQLVAVDGTVWLLASGRLVGLRGNERFAPVALAKPGSPLRMPLTGLTADARGRLWVVASRGGGPGAPPLLQVGCLDGDQVVPAPPLPASTPWSAPWIGDDNRLRVLTREGLSVGSVAAGETARPSVRPYAAPTKTAAELERREPQAIELDGRTYRLYWGELHTHLGEHPADWTIKQWVDRYYLRGRYDQGLDIAATSDHDWPEMTITKFMVQQAVAAVLNEPGRFVACSGFEWSGDNAVRRRYGDRTVVFLRDDVPITRITDETGNTPAKLHVALAANGGIDWPHHVGASWAIMDWTTHSATVEPVVEITSTHGVYETYDPAHVIAGWIKDPVGDRSAPLPPSASQTGPLGPRPMVGAADYTSLQYGLSQGHRFAFVGSSDSHNGISGYESGMLGVYATELTRAAVFEAWKARRAYAVRGGQRIAVDLRVNGTFMGGETTSDGPPRVAVTVRGTAPIEKIELVRNNQYVYVRTGDGGPDLGFEYLDQAAPPGLSYYYVRVFQEGDAYAWGSPVWVTRR